MGCLAGFGAVGMVIATGLAVLGGLVAVGALLLYLTCGGH